MCSDVKSPVRGNFIFEVFDFRGGLYLRAGYIFLKIYVILKIVKVKVLIDKLISRSSTVNWVMQK